jgi:hypothetical protein
VEAYAGLSTHADVNVPVLFSRLGAQPLFSLALDRPLTDQEISVGLKQLDELLAKDAPNNNCYEFLTSLGITV